MLPYLYGVKLQSRQSETMQQTLLFLLSIMWLTCEVRSGGLTVSADPHSVILTSHLQSVCSAQRCFAELVLRFTLCLPLAVTVYVIVAQSDFLCFYSSFLSHNVFTFCSIKSHSCLHLVDVISLCSSTRIFEHLASQQQRHIIHTICLQNHWLPIGFGRTNQIFFPLTDSLKIVVNNVFSSQTSSYVYRLTENLFV